MVAGMSGGGQGQVAEDDVLELAGKLGGVGVVAVAETGVTVVGAGRRQGVGVEDVVEDQRQSSKEQRFC